MNKSILSLFLVLFLLCSAAGFAESGPVEKAVTLHTESGEDRELTLRWFEETPNVPYMGINEYTEHLMHSPMALESNEDGTLTLKNSRGGELRCDVAAGTISTPDWVRVITPEMPVEGPPYSLRDSNCGFVRIKEITYEGKPAPVTFDFAKYGVRIYADDRDVYLPLSILTNMLTDVATNHLRYDGQALYQQRISLDLVPDDPILVNETLTSRLQGEARPADIVSQCYADLCFNFDYFFGYPGKAPLDPAMAEKGLDQALTDLGDEGAAIKAGLLSSSMIEYVTALQKLFLVYLTDGHTTAMDLSSLQESKVVTSDKMLSLKLTKDYFSDLTNSKNTLTQILRMAITPQRKLAWGDDVYREYGNTAIIRLDSFMPDEAAWAAWYKGKGDFPQDCVGIVVSGLRKAAENEKIKNVLLDLTCNSGGSSDILMMILGLTTGQDHIYGRNRLTGQSMLVTYETDNNFNGVFDEKDQEARFDFNYGVLTTRQAFSCGNLFPFIMKEGGAVIIGEPTGGGSCCIQVGTDSEGIRYLMSSCQWQLRDVQDHDVEGGCPVDIPISAKSLGLVDMLISKLGVDEGFPVFTAFFDDERLNTLMNAWFHVENELDPAA